MTDPKLKGKAKRREKTLLRAEKRSAVGTPTVKRAYKKLIKSKIKSL